MSILAGFILIPFGVIGSFRATESLRRDRLPVVDCGLMAVLGVAIVFGGLGMLVGTPVGLAAIALLAAWRVLALYNARLVRGRVVRRDVWPGALPELALSLMIAVGNR
ncbi:MAG TPA: hypothetical protein VIO16_04860 [Dehalococcoidia bacterium]